MRLPEVEISPEDSMDAAVAKVERALGAVGLTVRPFDNLNTVLSTSSRCHFFQVLADGRDLVLCVMIGAWDDGNVLSVLNILLNLRMDPDPPGQPPRIRFYSVYPVPPVLRSLFGDSPASDFECRAALVAHFGNDVGPACSLQFAAVAVHLLRECFGVKTSFFDRGGDLRVAEAVVDGFKGDGFPADAAPLNGLIVLGFLAGEILRARLPFESRWLRVKDYAPWPALVVGPQKDDAASPAPHVVLSPIALVMSAYESSSRTLLRDTAASVEAKCRETLKK